MKTAITWIIVLVVIIGGIYLLVHRASSPSVNYSNVDSSMQSTTTAPTGMASTTDSSTIGISASTSISTAVTVPTTKIVTVTYTDTGFSPKSVTINRGDTIKFVNNSSGKMWIGSANHPTHTVYDGTDLQQHCAAGATPSFDECKAEAKGATYSFTFDKAGTWGYHNHVSATFTGTVVVN